MTVRPMMEKLCVQHDQRHPMQNKRHVLLVIFLGFFDDSESYECCAD